jgi:hypothetical protein
MKSLLCTMLICVGLASFLGYASAQSHPAKNAAEPPATTPKKPVPVVKLTPEQEHGIRLLQSAEAEAAGLEPDMRAFVLSRVANAYRRIDPKKADKAAFDAFTATLAIPDPADGDFCVQVGSAGDIKSWIQQQVLYEMVHKDKTGQVEALLPRATAPVRDQITSELVRYYESKNDLPRAEALLSQVADSDTYPFGPAADLVTALGPEQSGERMAVFNQALNNYEQHAKRSSFGGDDIGTFIERTGKDVPPALVLEAITKVLEAAKDQQSDNRYSMTSAKGSLVLNSGYDLRLFQLLPLLQELDKDKAETLLRERVEVADQLRTYPKGMQSLQDGGLSVSFGGTSGSSSITGPAAQQQVEAQTQDRVREILKKADSDPAGALASALGLPVHGGFQGSPRAQALLQIAEKTTKKNPSVSKSALDEFSGFQEQLTPKEIPDVANLPELYLRLGDIEGAKKALKILLGAAGKLYEHDLDPDDPNKSFKGAWPSTDLWRKSVEQAAKISPSLPEEIISELPDPDIAAFEKVAYGRALAGGSGVSLQAPILISDCRKNGGASYRVSF